MKIFQSPSVRLSRTEIQIQDLMRMYGMMTLVMNDIVLYTVFESH